MNLTDEQKKYLVPASLGTLAFVLCDELVFRAPTKGGSWRGVTYSASPSGKAAADANLRKSLLCAAALTAVSAFVYEKSDASAKANIEKAALPAGAAAGTFIAVNRISAPFWRGTDRRPYAAGAAALAAWFANKDPDSSATIGMLPRRTMEPPFPPPFGPEFDPEFEG